MASMWPQERTNTSDVMAASRSSRESIASNFDPENEALMSTPQHLPTPKFMARRDERRSSGSQQDEADFAIDTSVLRKNFPEFTTISTSDEDDDASIEMGRGGRKTSRQLDDSRDSVMSVNQSHHSGSPAAKAGRYNSPSRNALHNVSNLSHRIAAMGRDSLRKDAQIRRASLAQKDNYVQEQKPKSGARQTSGTHRRSLSEMHAKATETYDGSFVSDERPHSATITARNTRFASNHKVADAVNMAAGKAYLQTGNKNASEKPDAMLNNTTSGNIPDNNTHQSFALPDVPDLSELVSGIYQQGAHITSRSPRPRNTRFASPPSVGGSTGRPEHPEVNAVPIPDDEMAIFASLKTLQDKVSQLEAENAAAERKIAELSVDAQAARQPREERSHRSAGERDHQRSSGRLIIEKTRLEEANLVMQRQLEAANRQNMAQETAIKNLTQQRDTAMSQIGISYIHTQELEQENEALRRENEQMLAQLEMLAIRSKIDNNQPTRAEASLPKTRSRIPDVTNSTNNDYDNTVESRAMTQSRLEQRRRRDMQTDDTDYSQRRRSLPEAELAKLQKEKDLEALFNIGLPSLRLQTQSEHDGKKGHHDSDARDKKQPNTSKQRSRRAAEDTQRSRVSNPGPRMENRSVVDDPTEDLTFLTFIDEQKIADLRKTLEEEYIARKKHEKSLKSNLNTMERPERSRFAPEEPLGTILQEITTNTVRPKTAEQSRRVESSYKEQTAEVPRKGRDRSVPRRTEHSEHATSGSRHRRRSGPPEMTSAFILPDITMHTTTATTKIPAGAQRVLDDMALHEAHNCSVCKRQGSGQCTHTHEKSNDKQTLNIPKPIPVSSRMPGPSLFNEDPTIRPSQPPALALAKVMKGLEDELAHLKMQLALYQNALNKHDASLGKKQRKAILRKIESYLTEIDTKSDQIYALYDVLEGQKRDGREMTERDVDITLESIGLDRPSRKDNNLTERLGNDGVVVVEDEFDSDTGSDETDDDDELPWEGIQSTVEYTGRSQSSRRH